MLPDGTMMWSNQPDELFGQIYKTYIDPIRYGGPILPIPIFQPSARTRFRDTYSPRTQGVAFADNTSRHGPEALARMGLENSPPRTYDEAFSELTARDNGLYSRFRYLIPDGKWERRDKSYLIMEREERIGKWILDHADKKFTPSHPVTPGLPSELRASTVTDLPKAAFSGGLRYSDRASRFGKEVKNVMREASESAERWGTLEWDLTKALRLPML